MEKFGAFSDKATGVRPFIPIQNKIPSWKKSLFYVLGFFKFILLIPSLLTMFINPFIGQFVPIYIIRLILTRVHHIIHGSLVLFFCGNYRIKSTPTPLIKKSYDEDGKWTPAPTHGDLIFSPLCSFLDLFYFARKFSPSFMIPIGKSEALVYSIFPLIFKILLNKDLRSNDCIFLLKGKVVNISEYVQYAKNGKRNPIVVFCECAPTNGTGILKYAQICETKSGYIEIPDDVRIHICGFKRVFEGISPNRVSGSLFKYITQIFGRFYEKVQVLVALEKDVEQCYQVVDGADGKKYKKIDQEAVEKIEEVTGKLLHLPVLEIDADAYVKYCEAAKGIKIKND